MFTHKLTLYVASLTIARVNAVFGGVLFVCVCVGVHLAPALLCDRGPKLKEKAHNLHITHTMCQNTGKCFPGDNPNPSVAFGCFTASKCDDKYHYHERDIQLA